MQKVAFGGGCHWCTEAVFGSLKGVQRVEQGWISAKDECASAFSEAVIVYFDTIPLALLVEIHLHTHQATSAHSMRKKYRSAVYTFSDCQQKEVQLILQEKQKLFEKVLVTKAYPFESFKLNHEKYLNYYKQNPDKPFCKTYIEPKLKMILEEYGEWI